VMEFCGGGDLAGYIRQHKKTTEAVARSFLQQLGAGMKEMWRNNFVHVRRPCPLLSPVLEPRTSQPTLSVRAMLRSLQTKEDSGCHSSLSFASVALNCSEQPADLADERLASCNPTLLLGSR